jgi:hypothetical protein
MSGASDDLVGAVVAVSGFVIHLSTGAYLLTAIEPHFPAPRAGQNGP